jgi:hypothetical protein
MACMYCAAGAMFSITRPSYHVTEYFEGHERDHILCQDKLRDLLGAGFRRALERIATSHVPDQPAGNDVDETVWIMWHVRDLRKIAADALEGK